MSRFSDDGPAPGDQSGCTEGIRPSERAKPLSPQTLDWMRRFQEAGVEMARDEECRKAIAARLF
jgi:hypothetical protein